MIFVFILVRTLKTLREIQNALHLLTLNPKKEAPVLPPEEHSGILNLRPSPNELAFTEPVSEPAPNSPPASPVEKIDVQDVPPEPPSKTPRPVVEEKTMAEISPEEAAFMEGYDREEDDREEERKRDDSE